MTPATSTLQDKEQIVSVLEDYVEGGRRGSSAVMEHAFHENATIHGYIDGTLFAGPIQLLFDWVTASEASPDLQCSIASIDIAGTIATARVEVTDWVGYRFTDLFTLFRVDGEWVITSKVFHVHGS